MGKIVHTTHSENGDINFVAGTISFVAPGTGEYKGKVQNVSMTIQEYVPEEKKTVNRVLQLAFWNSDDASKAQLADQVKNAKLKAGNFIFAVCGNITDTGAQRKDGTPISKATAFEFRFNHRRILEIVKDENTYENNIICGRVAHFVEGENPYIRIPVNKGPKDEQTTDWYTVFFMDKLRDSVIKNIKKGLPICVYTQKVNEKEHEGDISYVTTAMSYVIGNAPKAS